MSAKNLYVSGPPLGLLQDGCPRLFAGRGAHFKMGARLPLLKINHFNCYGYHDLGILVSIYYLVIILLLEVLSAPSLISEGVSGPWNTSGRVPGTRCSKSTGAYAPVAPVLTEALKNIKGG